jgi:hypothetical protein
MLADQQCPRRWAAAGTVSRPAASYAVNVRTTVTGAGWDRSEAGCPADARELTAQPETSSTAATTAAAAACEARTSVQTSGTARTLRPGDVAP